MAEERLDYSQIAKPNIFEPLVKEIQGVEDRLDSVEAKLKSVVSVAAQLGKETPLDSFSNIEKKEKAIAEATEAIKQLDKVEKDRIKLQTQLKNIDDDRVRANARLREQLRLQQKALRDEAKESLNTRNAYEQLLDSKKEAQSELLRLTATFGENSEEVAEARAEYKAISDRIDEINSVLKDAETGFDALNTQMKEAQKRAKDTAAEFGVTSKEAKEAADAFKALKKEVDDINKSLKEQIDTDEYEKLKKDTNEAQLEFKKLAAQFGITSNQAQEALERFEKLDDELREINDAARDGRKDVGRYEKGVKALTKTFKTFASATIVLKILELLQNSISQNSEGVAELEKIWVRVTTVIEVSARKIVDVFPIVRARIERFIISAQISFIKFKQSIDEAVDGVKNFFGVDTSGASDLSDKIKQLEKDYADLADEANGDLTAAFSGLGDEISDLIDKKIQLIDDTLQYRREIVGLEKDINELIPTQEKLRAQFEDDSASLASQIEGGVKFREELQKRINLEETILKRRLDLARQNAAANSVNVGAQEELVQAEKEYVEAVAANASELTAVEREIQKLRDDTTQQNLDFYIDDFDNRKTVNERIIADETQTFERRRDLLNQNLQLSEDSFTAQAEALNKSLRERGKAELDFDALRQKTSSTEIARIVQEAGLSEQLNTRVLEILRERRTVLQDNAEAQRDLNVAEAESARLLDDVALQEAALIKLQKEGVDLEKVLKSLTEERLQNDIDNLKERLAVATEGSEEFVSINQELNDKLLEQNQARIEKEKEASKKANEDIQEAQEVAFEALSDFVEQRSQRRIEAIDREIQAEQNRIQTLQVLAAQGNEDAENNLATTEQRQRELELRREQQIARQQQAELTLTAIQTYAAKTTAGDPNPLASTIADIEVLRAFVGTLGSFYEGTEDTGTVTNPIDSKGGRLAIIHNNERIMTAQQNKLVGDMSNAELAQLAYREQNRSLDLSPTYMVVKAIEQLNNTTKNKPTYMGSDYDSMTDMIITKVQKSNTLEKRHKKKGGIWG